jgi:diguanylate cyclase (GGDEF)-like protein
MPIAIERVWQRVVTILCTRPEIVGAGLGACAVVLLLATGAITRVDQRAADAWFTASKTAPSGRTVIVSVDGAVAAGGHGVQLPRAVLADLLLRLNEVGAARILIAVSLAGKTTAFEDGKLRDALAVLGRAKVGLARAAVISGSGKSARWARVPVDDQFARLVTLTASDLALDVDAKLRYDGLDELNREPLPSASAWLADREQGADRRFRIDFGIDLTKIPVADAADVLAGDLSQSEFSGAHVIIGSYSSTLGYGIPVPRYGELKRAQVIGLASETILLRREMRALPPLAAALALVALSASVGFWGARLTLPAGIGALVGISLCSVAIGANLQIHLGLLVPSAGLVVAALFGLGGTRISWRLHRSAQARRSEIETLQTMATRDPLTGLFNRRSFERELANAAGTPTTNFAVLLCDLDGFKQVNDSLGHQAGDILLRQIASRLATCVGDRGVAARLGGDEFALLLTNITADLAGEVARGLIAKVAEPIPIAAEQARVGISIGIAVSDSTPRNAEDLLARADAAMYRAKRARSGYEFSGDRAKAA